MQQFRLWKSIAAQVQLAMSSVRMPLVGLSLRLMPPSLLFIQVMDQVDPTTRQRLARHVVDVNVEDLAESYKILS